MLSIGPMSGGQGRYYEELATEDYYTLGGEPPGRWWGAFEKIGLSEKVTKNALHNLFAGRSPAGNDLVQNAGSNHRRPGFDFTFSAPKSVSVLWALVPAAGDTEARACVSRQPEADKAH